VCGEPIWGKYTIGAKGPDGKLFCEHLTESPYGDPNRMIEDEDSRFKKAKPVRARRVTDDTTDREAGSDTDSERDR